MPLLKRKRLLAAKVETTSGTAVSLSGTDAAFNIYNPVIQATIPTDVREAQGSFNSLPAVPGARMGRLTFSTDLGWDGTSTVPTWASVLLPGCGWVNSTGTFTPRSEAPGSNVKTLTMSVYCDGVVKTISGAAGNFKINLPTNKPATIDWDFMGVLVTPSDTSLLSPTYPTALPLKLAGGVCTWNSVTLYTNEVTVESGNEIVLREDPTNAAGYIAALITSRAPKITAKPEAVTAATQDRWAAWLASTENSLALRCLGPGASVAAQLNITAPKAQIMNLQEGERNKMVTDEITWGCNRNGATADQELSIAFVAGS